MFLACFLAPKLIPTWLRLSRHGQCYQASNASEYLGSSGRDYDETKKAVAHLSPAVHVVPIPDHGQPCRQPGLCHLPFLFVLFSKNKGARPFHSSTYKQQKANTPWTGFGLTEEMNKLTAMKICCLAPIPFSTFLCHPIVTISTKRLVLGLFPEIPFPRIAQDRRSPDGRY
ncbi:MAG: hypothetical protein JRE28_13595 [Deltaproteobacteria bacterium]|nr:hypothetical protein [Deltaproteobacteria bacterium]